MLRKLLPFALALGLIAACQVADPRSGYDVTTVAFPQGLPEEGRDTFVELGCASCHEVAWDPELPDPVVGVPGPLLDANIAVQTPGLLATSIIAPSHNLSPRMPMSPASDRSPMWDMTGTMTVRELIDLIAYIRAQGGTNLADAESALEEGMLPHHL